MAKHPRYTDAQVYAAVDEFRAGGDPLPPDILAHLSPGQLRYFQRALEQMERALLREWQRDWWNGEIDEIPPGGVWT
jgi:hypothetical protein